MTLHLLILKFSVTIQKPYSKNQVTNLIFLCRIAYDFFIIIIFIFHHVTSILALLLLCIYAVFDCWSCIVFTQQGFDSGGTSKGGLHVKSPVPGSSMDRECIQEKSISKQLHSLYRVQSICRPILEQFLKNCHLQ